MLPGRSNVNPGSGRQPLAAAGADPAAARKGQTPSKDRRAERVKWLMPRHMTRERMIEAIRELPADASVDDAIERLVFLAKIEEGLAQLDRGERISHEEVKQRLGL